MSTPLPVGPLSPYVSPEYLAQAPTGISWDNIIPGRNASEGQKIAEMANICARSTAMCDEAANQPLRATTDSVVLYGPGVRVWAPQGCSIQPAILILKRWPVLQVNSVQVAQNTLPLGSWTTVPAGYWRIERPVIGTYGTSAPSGAGEGGQAATVGAMNAYPTPARDKPHNGFRRNGFAAFGHECGNVGDAQYQYATRTRLGHFGLHGRYGLGNRFNGGVEQQFNLPL